MMVYAWGERLESGKVVGLCVQDTQRKRAHVGLYEHVCFYVCFALSRGSASTPLRLKALHKSAEVLHPCHCL